MEKPITLTISELKNDISKLVNESKLPVFILDNIFREFYSEVHMLSLQQEQAEKVEYEKYLAENMKE